MMIEIIKDIKKMRSHFGWDETDTNEFLVNALLEEVLELKESLNDDEASFKSELADVLNYALALCIDNGYDVHTIIKDKIKEVMMRDY